MSFQKCLVPVTYLKKFVNLVQHCWRVYLLYALLNLEGMNYNVPCLRKYKGGEKHTTLKVYVMEEYANVVELKSKVSIHMYLQKERNTFSTNMEVCIYIVHITEKANHTIQYFLQTKTLERIQKQWRMMNNCGQSWKKIFIDGGNIPIVNMSQQMLNYSY